MIDGARHSDGVTIGRDDAHVRRAVVVRLVVVGAVVGGVVNGVEVVDLHEGVFCVGVRGDVGHHPEKML